nr:low temperature requirement protein A [uncultured Sphingomonas sp.]
MADTSRMLTRPPHHGHHAAADFSELFFDLVYVFAVTQLSHFLLHHHDLIGVLQALVMFLAVWWAWVFTTWATNWLDPTKTPNRLMLFSVMLVSLVMSSSIPRAFEDRALWFAGAYVAIQVLRTVYLVMVARRERPELATAMTPTGIAFALSGCLWIAGAFADPERRLWIWAVAVMIEYALPIFLANNNREGRSDMRAFQVTGAHMAERCGLFIIIALGEGIIITGATFTDLTWDGPTVAAMLIAFTGTVAMWWIYFNVGAVRGSALIAEHEESGRVARDAYTYAHVPIVAGIILTAMADEMLLAHPTGHLDPAMGIAALGGSALFLTGTMVFKRITGGLPWWPLSHMVGTGLFVIAAIWVWFAHPAPLIVGGLSLAILLLVAMWEWGSFNGGWVERGVPQPKPLRRHAEKLMERHEQAKRAKKPVPPGEDHG